ncbi:ROK family transcriptional regulator [Rhizobium sp. SL42]|uniref:ROK family transcriptional regulator n=1 Tax=Rhizobium sp. SL42 TaxID=2806346 RepID=UPI001F38EF62|nr:ROK family transcriptional regulator [Rhizobium sp. SL42]UJW76793.1 ROK family transcriptional regulator [Rhizobium sp. SL42]
MLNKSSQKTSNESVRQQNSGLVLQALRHDGPLAHTDLSASTGLSSATVSAITAELEKTGLIERREVANVGHRGRPRVLFSRRRDAAHVIAVRISSHAVQYSLADYRGTLIDRIEEPRDHGATTSQAFLAGFRAAIERLIRRSRLPEDAVTTISISSKGIADRDGAKLLWSPIFGYESLDFESALSGLLNSGFSERGSIRLFNESLLVTHALLLRLEKTREAPLPALATLSLGHSIGLGVALRDRNGLVRVVAPNFGHMLHAADGKLCRCGAYGCVEASAGFYGILRAAFEVPPDTIPAKFVPLTEMEKIASRARQGHRVSEYAFRQAGLALGQSLSRMLSLAEETMPIAITGPGTRFMDLLMRGLTEGLGQSQHVRVHGAPELLIITEEETLVFEGHVDRALTEIDQDLGG